MTAVLDGELPGALTLFARSSQLLHRINREYQAVIPLGNLAEVTYGQGRFQEAIDLAKDALAISERNGDRLEAAWLLGNLGNYYLALGDDDSAASFTRDALAMALDVGDEWQALCCLDTCIRVANGRGEAETAARLLGYVEGRLSVLKLPRQPLDHKLMTGVAADIRVALGAEPTELLLMEGRSLSCERMLALTVSRSSKVPSDPSVALREARN
jgi:tetratricopeptide (TPR) repeat protein